MEMVSFTVARSANRVPLGALLGANVISNIGNAIAAIAIPWFVLETTGSASLTGLAAAVTALSTILAGIAGGAVVDRLGHKQTSIVADIASALTVAAIPLLYATIGLQYWQLLLLVFLGAVLDAPGYTARAALLPDLAYLARLPLASVNTVTQTFEGLSSLLGLPLGGVLIALLSVGDVLWIDAATFVVSAALVALLVPAAARPERQAGGYLHDLREGFGYIRRHPVLRTILLLLFAINFLAAPLFGVLLPVYARAVYGDALSLGLVIAGFGAGSLVGSLLLGVFGSRLSRRTTFVLSFLGVGLPFFVLATQPGLWISVGLMALVGLMAAPINPIAMTVMQQGTPKEMLGRVLGLAFALSSLSSPLGLLFAGTVVEWLGIAWTLVLVAVGSTTVGLASLASPSLRLLDQPPTNGPQHVER